MIFRMGTELITCNNCGSMDFADCNKNNDICINCLNLLQEDLKQEFARKQCIKCKTNKSINSYESNLFIQHYKICKDCRYDIYTGKETVDYAFLEN